MKPVKQLLRQAAAKIITGPPANVESGYNEFIAAAKKPGLDKLSDFMTDRLNDKVAAIKKYSEGLNLPPGFMQP